MKKYSLFIDTSTDKMCLALYSEKVGRPQSIKILQNERKHTELAVELLFNFLKANKVEPSQIKKIFTTDGFGSQIGIYTHFLIIETLQLIYPKIQIYTAPTLSLQGWFSQKRTNCIKISKTKYVCLINDKIKKLNQDEIDFHWAIDFNHIRKILNHFSDLHSNFVLSKKLSVRK